MIDLTNKKILVTGATGAIGKEIVKSLLLSGAKVALISRSSDPLKKVCDEFKSLGEEVLYAINLALQDINDPSIKIYPKDIGSKNENINQACEEFEKEKIKIIIGPIDSKVHKKLNNFENLIFLSLSNIDSNINKNILTMGINLESQLLAIKKFIKNEKKIKR